MKYILYGAGHVGKVAEDFFGTDNVKKVLVSVPDNKKEVKSYNICKYDKTVLGELKGDTYEKVVICVTPYSKAAREIESLLKKDDIPFCLFEDIRRENTRRKIMSRPDHIGIYKKAINWINNNTINNRCIVNNNNIRIGYPEVTGYYIPTLLDWGYRDLACEFGKWLCNIQKADGSWYDTYNKNPYVFDSAQIIKGLMRIRRSIDETELRFEYNGDKLDDVIIKGCNWIISNMSDDGRLTTPSIDAWGDKRTCSELIHLYCLTPLIDAGDYYDIQKYKEAAKKILDYYTSNYYNDIVNFSLLSHFYSYVMEALVDLGRTELVMEAMANSKALQDEMGFVPAYNDVHWCCSTGLFQQALVWYKLGNIEDGNKSFEYACRLQNKTGGWYGSYSNPDYPDEINDYFPDSEISWAVKYFLDALHYKNVAEFNRQASSFIDEYNENDRRYQIVREVVSKQQKNAKIADVGCGKGGYLKNLITDVPDAEYYGIDISEAVMKYVDDSRIKLKSGSLTSIPYPNDYFDMIYACESLEHAIDINSAIREMARVTKPGGTLLIIDKNKDHLGDLEIESWEQWFDEKKLSNIMMRYCISVNVEKDIDYGHPADGLFYAWIGRVK